MKYVYASIAAFLVLAVCYAAYGFVQLRNEAFKVYDVEKRYTYGPENADLSIIYFNDYDCKNCQQFQPVLMEAVKRDGKIRYIPRIVTRGIIWSETLAAATYAAGEQGKFIEMHNAIYKGWPVKDEDKLLAYARALELDVKKFSRDMNAPETIDRVREDQTFYDAWRIPSTPAVLIGEVGIYYPMRDGTVPSVEDIFEKFEKAR